jgi:hypothetical protein
MVHPVIFLWLEFAILLFTKKETYSRKLFEKFPKNLPHSQEESNEISKILGGFG